MENNLLDINLHDAEIVKIICGWNNKTVQIEFSGFFTNAKKREFKKVLFYEVTHLNIPHKSPWGDSYYVSEQKMEEGIFRIIMNSGDIIEIEANKFQVC